MMPSPASLLDEAIVKALFNEFYYSLFTEFRILGHEMPEDVAQRKDIKSQGSLQDFIDIAHEAKSDQVSLLSLVHQLREDESNRVAQVVQPHVAGMPGFSNNPLAQPEKYQEVQTTMDWKEVLAVMVTKEQAKDTNHIRHIFNEEVPRNVVASCEDQLINGNGDGITGLLHASGAISPTFEESYEESPGCDISRVAFLRNELQSYASRTGRKPTHIILPYPEILELAASGQRMANAARGFPNKLCGVPIIESKYVPEGRGLIIAADEIVLASSPGLEWEFGHSNSELEAHDLSAIILKCKMGLLINRPETLVQLRFYGPNVENKYWREALAKAMKPASIQSPNRQERASCRRPSKPSYGKTRLARERFLNKQESS